MFIITKLIFLFLLLSFLFVSAVAAQVIFPAPIPITIRDSLTRTQHNVLLVGADTTSGNAVESDRGPDPHDSGSILYFSSAAGATSFIPGDVNIPGPANTDTLEFTANFDVLTSTGWVPGTGYVIGFIFSSLSPRLGQENGLGNPSFASIGGPTSYTSYNNRYGTIVPPDRHYGAQAIAINPPGALSSYPFAGGGSFTSIFGQGDIEGNIVAFATTEPILASAVTTQPAFATGACPVFPSPAVILNVFPPVGPITCYYFNKYIGYVDLSTITPATEGLLLPIAGSSAATSSAATTPGVYEDHPSVSVNSIGETLIARETNLATFPSTSFDIQVYNIATASEIAIIPEIGSSLRNQLLPTFDYPFIGFLELPNLVYLTPGFLNFPPANLHLADISGPIVIRTTSPIARRVVNFPKLAYDPASQTGILAFEQLTIGGGPLIISYVLLNAGGVASPVTTVPLPPGAGGFGGQGNLAVTSNGGIHTIYYEALRVLPGAISQTQEIYAYDVLTTSNTLLFSDPQIQLLNPTLYGVNSFSVTGNGKLLSAVTAPVNGGIVTPILINIDMNVGGCSISPCAVYENGISNRGLTGGNSYIYQEPILLDNNAQTPLYAAHMPNIFLIGTTLGRLDIGNLY